MNPGASNPGVANLAAFHLLGDRSGLPAQRAENRRLRPALFAGYRDLSRLRYDFPLILGANTEQVWVRSLVDSIDLALQQAAPQGIEGEQIRRQVLSLEQQIRDLVASGQTESLSLLWEKARQALLSDTSEATAESLSENLDKAYHALAFDGEVVACDSRLPLRLIRHAWDRAQRIKAMQLHTRIRHLEHGLSDILRVDYMRSGKARSAKQLKSSLGARDHTVFDFQAMARILKSVPLGRPLPKQRRQRINDTMAVLNSQEFVAANGADTKFNFAYENCDKALAVFRQRLPDMAKLVKAISIAELEIENRYDELQHDSYYSDFDAEHLGPGDLALFPCYLVYVEDGDSTANTQSVLDLLRSGLPFKIVARTDNIAGNASAASGQLSFGMQGQQLAGMALGLNHVFVMQSTAASLYRVRDSIIRGLCCDQPALFSVYGGSLDEQAHYLVAAAATESRAFPCFVYDPSAGMDLAARFNLDGNPQSQRDWSRHSFQYEDAEHNTQTEEIAFTLVDFMACDRRFSDHFASTAPAQWDSNMLPVDAFLELDAKSRPGKIPYILVLAEDNVLQRAVCNDKLIDAAQRCQQRWHTLQELGGIHNSHAKQALAAAQETWEKEKEQLTVQTAAAGDVDATAAVPAGVTAEAPAPTSPVMEAAVETPPPETAGASSDEPWIETIRCTTCNECTELNSRMFAYDEDQRAYIADPDAGTYGDLVEAAETCQVAIIHPGKPRNPDEPGLEGLLERAEPFNA